MFGVKHNECVGFESRWKVKKVSCEGSTQTTPFSLENTGTNTSEKNEIQIQTESPLKLTNNDTNMEELATWMKKIYPSVKKELDEANNSKAFKGYQLSSDQTEATCKLIQELKIENEIEANDLVEIRSVSSISWNCSGNTLAVACSYTHQTWCYHTGRVLIFTLNREDKFPELPNKKLSLDSCAVLVTFHPKLPAVCAVYTFSGGIQIWNVQEDDGKELVFTINGQEHTTQLSWIQRDYLASNLIYLVCSNLEGLLTIWKINNNCTSHHLYETYKIKAPFLSKNTKVKERKKDSKLDTSFGIICFDFSNHVPDLFVTGLEGGFVIECSTSKPTKIKGGTELEPFYDPVVRYYESHEGNVTSAMFCPNKSDMFMTTGMDLQTRIYLIGQNEPARVIFLKTSSNPLAWIPHEEHIIVGYGFHGELEIYDLIEGKIINADDSKKLSNEVTTAEIQINLKKPHLLAAGLKKGNLQLWTVPWTAFTNLCLTNKR